MLERMLYAVQQENRGLGAEPPAAEQLFAILKKKMLNFSVDF